MPGYFFGAPLFTDEFEAILRTPDHFARLSHTNDRSN
jgi:hypothetical protein